LKQQVWNVDSAKGLAMGLGEMAGRDGRLFKWF